MSYDEKYRRQAVSFKDSGHTFRELKEVFGVSAPSYFHWKRLKATTGFYAPKPTEKQTRRRKIDPEKLKAFVAENPDAYLREIAEVFDCSAVAIFKRLKELKISLKKRPLPTPKNRKLNASNSLND